MNIRVATVCCLCKRSDTPTLCCAYLYAWVLSLSLGGRAQAELGDFVKWLPVRINRIMDTSPQQRTWHRVCAQSMRYILVAELVAAVTWAFCTHRELLISHL